MKNETEDRRSRRSRRLLKEGLLELMREKRFSEITVRDITERMDLNRGTFYLHYPDTTALLQSVETDMLAEAQALIDAHMAQTKEERTLRPVFEPILDYVVEHREVCQALFVNNSSSNFTDRLHQLIRVQRTASGPGVVPPVLHGADGVPFELCDLRPHRIDEDLVRPGNDHAQGDAGLRCGPDGPGSRRGAFGDKRYLRI